MKRFSCGDVVPGCEASWVCPTDEDILARVAAHARADHGMTDIPDEVVSAVRSRIVIVD